MRDAGVDIQAHSAHTSGSAQAYDKVTKRKLNAEEYTDWLNAEVAGSKATLEQKLGIRVNCFAVPFGYYNDRVKEGDGRRPASRRSSPFMGKRLPMVRPTIR